MFAALQNEMFAASKTPIKKTDLFLIRKVYTLQQVVVYIPKLT